MPKKFNARPKTERLAPGDWLIDQGGKIWPTKKELTEDQRKVREVLERMPDPYRSVLEMRFYGQMTLQAIAEEMGWKDRRWTWTYLRRGKELLGRIR